MVEYFCPECYHKMSVKAKKKEVLVICKFCRKEMIISGSRREDEEEKI